MQFRKHPILRLFTATFVLTFCTHSVEVAQRNILLVESIGDYHII